MDLVELGEWARSVIVRMTNPDEVWHTTVDYGLLRLSLEKPNGVITPQETLSFYWPPNQMAIEIWIEDQMEAIRNSTAEMVE